MLALSRLAPFGAALACALALAPQDPPTPTSDEGWPEADALLARVAVVGASASAGFNLEAELDGRPLTLAEALGRVLPDASEVVDASDTLIFTDAEPRTRAVVERARAAEPSLVVGVDLLFWHVYGPAPRAGTRAERLERGLALVAGFEAPLLVGTFPDVSHASEVMLPPSLIPPREFLDEANARLVAWAAESERVVLVDLRDWVARVRDERPIRLRDNEWDEVDVTDLVQWDGLHPTVEGTVALGLLALDALDVASGGAVADRVRWDARAVAEALREGDAEPAPDREPAPVGGGAARR